MNNLLDGESYSLYEGSMKKRLLRLPERSIQATAMVRILLQQSKHIMATSLLELRPMVGHLSYTQFTQVRFLQLRSCFSGAMAAQLLRKQQVVGSNPTGSSHADIVQEVVRMICNHLISVRIRVSDSQSKHREISLFFLYRFLKRILRSYPQRFPNPKDSHHFHRSGSDYDPEEYHY